MPSSLLLGQGVLKDPQLLFVLKLSTYNFRKCWKSNLTAFKLIILYQCKTSSAVNCRRELLGSVLAFPLPKICLQIKF